MYLKKNKHKVSNLQEKHRNVILSGKTVIAVFY